MKNIIVSIMLSTFCFFTFPLFAQQSCEELDRIPLPAILESVQSVVPIPPAPPLGNPPKGHADRIVFWTHGLGGTASSWAPAANVSENPNNGIGDYPARRIISDLPSYVSAQNVNLDAAARDYMLQLESTTNTIINNPDTPSDYDKFNNFVIAHSQGGLVSRWADMLYANETPANRTFGGVVTFGTSHGGAAIIENEHLVFELGAELCSAISEPKVLETIETSFIFDLFLNGENLAEFTGNTCDFLGNNGLQALLAGQNQNITNDYKPNAPALSTLKNHDSNNSGVQNKVAFYGVESEPVLWNLLNGLANKPEEQAPFQANDDGNLKDWAEDQQTQARMKEMEWRMAKDRRRKRASILCNTLVGFLPVGTTVCLIARNRANEASDIWLSWNKAKVFWESANDKYKLAMGGLVIEETTTQKCLCEEEIPGGNGEKVTYVYPGACQTNSTNCRTIMSTEYGTPMDFESDGVVPMHSAIDYPNAKIGQKMSGSNHQQMRNDTNTKDRLNELWQGNHGNFFITEVKQ